MCIQRCFSTTSTTRDKVYEIRTYVVHPRDQRPFLDLTKEWIHLRTGHSKLIGYWTNELGDGINDLVHLWEYGVYNQIILVTYITKKHYLCKNYINLHYYYFYVILVIMLSIVWKSYVHDILNIPLRITIACM